MEERIGGKEWSKGVEERNGKLEWNHSLRKEWKREWKKPVEKKKSRKVGNGGSEGKDKSVVSGLI